MNELIKEGDIVKIFLKDKYVFEGYVINQSDNFLKIFDHKTRTERIIELNGVSNIELTNELSKFQES